MNKKIVVTIIALVVIIGGGILFTKFNGNTQKSTASETVTVKHGLGETSLNKSPKNVVVFDYGILDTLDTLGIEVKGVAKDNLPEFLKKYSEEKYASIGSIKEPDMEKIYELKPDLIIISARQAKYYEELTKIAPTVHLNVDSADYMGSFKENMKVVGQIFGKEKEVDEKLKGIEETISAVKTKAEQKKANALITLSNDGSFSVYGQNSRFGFIHNALGLTPVDPNIETATHGQKASFEYIAEKNPNYLFVIDRTAVVGGEKAAKDLFENELMKKTDVYKNNRIVYLDAATWYTATGGLNTTLKMAEEVNKALDI